MFMTGVPVTDDLRVEESDVESEQAAMTRVSGRE